MSSDTVSKSINVSYTNTMKGGGGRSASMCSSGDRPCTCSTNNIRCLSGTATYIVCLVTIGGVQLPKRETQDRAH